MLLQSIVSYGAALLVATVPAINAQDQALQTPPLSQLPISLKNHAKNHLLDSSGKSTSEHSANTLTLATNGTASTEPTAGTSEEQKTPVAVAFEQNSHWRRNLAELQPELFKKLGRGQSPEILWIGCADSRCPETTILGLQPGDIFCHRNIANILVPTDLNSLSVIQYAVQYLKVKHIIVCGHTSCGGIAAALANKKLGLIDTWLMPLRHLRAQNSKMLEALPEKERSLKMVDLNVRRSVAVLMENPVVMEAMIERGLQLHGVIYDVGSGELNELDIAEDEEIVEERKKAFKVEE